MTENNRQESCGAGCGCGGLGRRDFLKAAVAGVGVAMMGEEMGGIMAGPFTSEDFEKLVPADKRLSAEWVKSLYERGERTWYHGRELEWIGMPIGGICAGQVYLGGDGKLWHWDIFNQHIGTGDGHYARPMKPGSPLSQGFAVRVVSGGGSQTRTLDRAGFRDVRFCGEYPMGFVEYRDEGSAVAVDLEAFSPFVPLNAEDSALPAIVMRYTVRNTSKEKVEVSIGGWLQNAVCLYSGKRGARRNRIRRGERMTFLECGFEEEKPTELVQRREDILFENFEKETYDGWTAEGTAFGAGPVEKAKMPAYQGDVGSKGKGLVNTHNTRQGEDVVAGDAHVGSLTSREFVIERGYIALLIGGGAHQGRTCINLLVDGKVVDSMTGENDNRMKRKGFDVRKWAGKKGRLQIVDNEKGAWGNIGIDEIVFTDTPPTPETPLKQRADYGTMGLALLGKEAGEWGMAGMVGEGEAERMFAQAEANEAVRGAEEKLIGVLGRNMELGVGEEKAVSFVVTWHFPNLKLGGLGDHQGRWYGKRFGGAYEAAESVAKHFDSLRGQTRLWWETWYDSTLPRWFLDRTFLNTSILATSTAYWFGNGRFYGWEGVGCCAGTCGHVWHYAQAVGRLFPQFERNLREQVDFGLAMQKNGAIWFRGEHNNFAAADGQAGVVLRALREHQVSADDAFLKRNWEKIRKALQYLIDEDGNGDGILEGKQHNTLDTDWYGPVGWLSSLYLAALRAGEEMGKEVGDEAFARTCRGIFEKGRRRIVETCWNGEYFNHRPDPKHPEAMKVGNGCEIDQVMGQGWAWQVGLGRVIDREHTLGALKAIWKYNFTPDVGPYRNANKLGRWYAMPGEAGTLMCTWPRGDKADAQGKAPDWAFGYFNECMNGFEYQVAGHMIWEGMVQEGLAATRAVHDRYGATKRNPWNEVECGDHYARSMASYGVYLAACGFEYHGPRGRMAFEPRMKAEDFRAAWTGAEGWGTAEQKRSVGEQVNGIVVKWGKLRLHSVGVRVEERLARGRASVTVNGKEVEASEERDGAGRIEVNLAKAVILGVGDRIVVRVGEQKKGGGA